MAVTESSNKSDYEDGPIVHASLAAALAAFHLERPRVVKDSDNPHFGNRYASLDAFESAVLPLLAKHGLTWVCLPSLSVDVNTEQPGLVVTWRLIHAATGDELFGTWPLVSGTSQAIGSSLTYAKRYLLSAVSGVSAEDDDNGEAASKAMERRAERERDELTDWTHVLEEADATNDIPTLRRLYVAKGVRRAPKDVQEAFAQRVAELQDNDPLRQTPEEIAEQS